MTIDFSKFDSMVDLDGLKADIEKAKGNTGDYEAVPHGTYEVEIAKLELTQSKKSDPMVTCWFRILTGDYESSMLFMNQVITKGFQLHIVNDFLRSLQSGVDIDFVSYSQYNDLLMDVMEAVDGRREYSLEYGEKKGFNTFKILEVFELESDDSEE